MSTIIIGGGGRAAIQKLVDAYPKMSAEKKAAALQLELRIVNWVDAFLEDDKTTPPPK
jgi:hypothetical protein